MAQNKFKFSNQILENCKIAQKLYLPSEACKTLGPILESTPMRLLTSVPVASHIADIEIIFLILVFDDLVYS